VVSLYKLNALDKFPCYLPEFFGNVLEVVVFAFLAFGKPHLNNSLLFLYWDIYKI
jgi:hypothetical protein